MCECLDNRWVEYPLNVVDILTDVWLAYSIAEECIGWSASLFALSVFGTFGVLLKMLAQCYRREERNIRTNRKQLYWRRECAATFYFGVCIELLFEGVLIGVIEMSMVGNASIADVMKHHLVDLGIILVKEVYVLYMVMKYCMLSKDDTHKGWFIMYSMLTMMVVSAIAACAFLDIFPSTTVLDCIV